MRTTTANERSAATGDKSPVAGQKPGSKTYRPPSDPYVPGIPEVCIVSPTACPHLIHQLNLLNVQEFQVENVSTLLLRVHEIDMAAVLLAPGDAHDGWVHRQMQDLRCFDVPVLLYQPTGVAIKQAAHYYGLSIEMILHDEADLFDLPRFISAMIRHRVPERRLTVQDLSDAVRYRIQMEAHFDADDIRISQYNGIVDVTGFVSSYWKRQYLCEIIETIPGVKQLRCHNLQINERPLEDNFVNEVVWNAIRSEYRLLEETLMVTSTAGHVTISGTLGLREDMAELCEQLTEHDAIESVNCNLIESKYYQEFCLERAQHIEQSLRDCDMPQSVRVSVCGSLVGLSGYMPDETMDAEIVIRCLGEEGVSHVLNTCVISNSDYNYTNHTL